MIDVSKMIIAKSDQLNADDLIGNPITVKITGVKTGSEEQPLVISYEGDNKKPYKPSKGMRRVLMRCWGLDGEKYVGKSMTLFNNPEVRYAGGEVGGIQISHASHIDKTITMALAISRGKKVPYVIKPLVMEKAPPASAELLAAGLSACEGGIDAYKAWLADLNDVEKASIKYKHSEWSKIARESEYNEVEEETL